MSFYNFKLNDHSSFSTSSPSDSKNAGRFVHKTFEDFQSKNNTTLAPQATPSNTVMTNDGRGKFAVSGWKEKKVIAPSGDKNPLRLENPPPIDKEIPEEIHAVSITSSLQGITHTYSPMNIATLHSLGSPTSIRLVKLTGQGAWHTH